jgi:cytosine/adenosine deaminase-related metal-dependent hydrolase
MNILAKSCAHLKLTMRKIFLYFGLFCLGTSALAQQGDPDLILFNGKIFTGVEARPYVEALAIRGERIVATGDTKTIQAMAGPKTNAIDLHGGTAIPGINDAHHHFQLGPPEVDVDLQTPDPSWAQVKDRVPDSAAIVQLRQQLDEEAKYGVTSIQELSITMRPSRAVSLLERSATQIRVRVVRMPGTTPAGRDIEEGKGVPAHPASLITVSGTK